MKVCLCILLEHTTRSQIPSPPKLNPFVCKEDSDVDSAPSDSDSNSDSYGSSDTEEISGSDKSYHPGSSVSSNSDDGSTMEVNPVVQPDEDDLMVLNARNSHRWGDHWLSTSEGKMAAITRWNHSLCDYHFCTEPQEVNHISVSFQLGNPLTVDLRFQMLVLVPGKKQLSWHFEK